MARLILIDTKAKYDAGVADNSIPKTALCFIQETCELRTQGGVFGTGDLKNYVKTDDPRLSDARKNPHAIKFTGYLESEYDGSSEVTIDLPTSLPASDVYDWAKAETKPSYTYDEVGAAAKEHTHDTYIQTDIKVEGTGNAFTSFSFVGNVLTLKKDSTFLTSADMSNYATLDSPTFTGKPTAPTVEIVKGTDNKSLATNEAVVNYVEGKNYITADSDITGNAATATKWKDAVTINLGNHLSGSCNFDGSVPTITLNATLVYKAITNNSSLDTLKTDGWYNAPGTITVTNVPTDGWVAGKEFSIHVEKIVTSATVYTIRQVCRQGLKEWVRSFDSASSEWSDWETDVTNNSEYLKENFVTVDGAQDVNGKKTFKGGIVVLGASASQALFTQGIVGVNASGASDVLYLQYGVNKQIKLGNTGAHYIKEDGSYYSGKSATSGKADEAVKATQDANGDVITDTYAKKTDSFFIGSTEVKLNQATGTITSLDVDITGNAESATKATQDDEGNVIKDTYAKHTDSFYIGTTKISLNQESGTITKLEGIEITGTIVGNAETATKWAKPITLTVNGSEQGTVSFDGSKDVTLELSVNHNHDATYVKKTGDKMTGLLETNNDIYFNSTAAIRGIRGTYNSTHNWRLVSNSSNSTAKNEIELAVTGTDPIYVRQYTSNYAAVSKQVLLLDAAGNSSFPGNVTATKFIGALQGNADSATKAEQDGDGNVISDTYATKDQKFFLGNTEIAINRAQGALTLNGVNISGSSGSCTGNAATVTDGVYASANNNLTGINTFSNDLWVTGGKSIKYTPTSSDTKHGLMFYNQAKSAVIAGIGVHSVGDAIQKIYLGWGADPTLAANSLIISSSVLQYKSNNIYHAGNSNKSDVNWTMNVATANSLNVSGTSTLGNTTIKSTDYCGLTLLDSATTSGDTGIKFQNMVAGKASTLGTMGFLANGYFVMNAGDTDTDDMINISPDGIVSAKTFRGALDGNAKTATSAGKFTANKTITLTGSVTGSVTTDFSGNVTINTSTNHTHTASQITDFTTEVNKLVTASFESPAFTGIPTTPNPDGNTPTQVANVWYVKQEVAGIVGSAPAVLDTLEELAKALGDDPNFATTIAGELGKKIPLAGSQAITGDLFFANAALNTWRGIGGVMGTGDKWRLASYASAANSGYIELATTGTGNEVIYVRQYSGSFGAKSHEIILMDVNGNSSFNNVTATKFIGTADKAVADRNGAQIDTTYLKKAVFDEYVEDGWTYL